MPQRSPPPPPRSTVSSATRTAGPTPGAGHQPERVQVDLRFPSLAAAEILLDFGTDAEVLAPAELRQALARKAAAAARYATSAEAHARPLRR